MEEEKKYGDESNNISFNFNNEKELAKICFLSMEEKPIFESQCPFNNCIGDAIKDFLSNQNKNDRFTFYIKNNDSQEFLIKEEKLVSFYIAILQDTLLLMEQGMHNSSNGTTSISSNKILKVYAKKHEKLKVPKNIEEYIINNTDLIGKPALNKMKYYIYNKNIKELQEISISNQKINQIQINYFSRKSVYCNAKNNLFIYEGVDEPCINDKSSKFISINLKNNNINYIASDFPSRILHSMIFIPEKYIFIIGGKNSKDVIFYIMKDNNKKYDTYLYKLPYELFEPSLITVDNRYLYAFENSTFCFHIIRTDFISLLPFEEIQLKNDNSITINQKFFGVVKQNNSILFLGGQMLNPEQYLSKNSFEFNYSSEILNQNQRKFKSFDFFEKTFIPLGGESYIQLIEYTNENDYFPKIILFEGGIKGNKLNNVIQQNGFIPNHIKNIKINMADNLTSLVGTSSFGEMPVPLYNNSHKK